MPRRNTQTNPQLEPSSNPPGRKGLRTFVLDFVLRNPCSNALNFCRHKIQNKRNLLFVCSAPAGSASPSVAVYDAAKRGVLETRRFRTQQRYLLSSVRERPRLLRASAQACQRGPMRLWPFQRPNRLANGGRLADGDRHRQHDLLFAGGAPRRIA